MDLDNQKASSKQSISFYGGIIGALLPFIVFVTGVIIVALSGAPDEKGFWPILILALALGLFLAKDKHAFSETVIEGMSQKIVMIMIMAWLLASIIGVLMTVTGFVEALTWVIGKMQMGGVGFVVTTFIICAVVSLSTGSSFATILICGPILYPAGGLAGAHLATLAGAIIGGILGNQNSTVGGKQMRCRTMSRYKESMETMYSHSTITFIYEGKQYSLNFKK